MSRPDAASRPLQPQQQQAADDAGASLHVSLLLLGFDPAHAAHGELSLGPGMFQKPNSRGLEAVLHFLMAQLKGREEMKKVGSPRMLLLLLAFRRDPLDRACVQERVRSTHWRTDACAVARPPRLPRSCGACGPSRTRSSSGCSKRCAAWHA